MPLHRGLRHQRPDTLLHPPSNILPRYALYVAQGAPRGGHRSAATFQATLQLTRSGSAYTTILKERII